MRERYVIRGGELIPKHLAPRQPVQRSSLPCPAIRTDGMDAIRSMADGQFYDSKSAYYGSVKAAGCEIVGDDRLPDPPSAYETPGVAQSISDAIDQLEAQ
jgi:hypothetical protein